MKVEIDIKKNEIDALRRFLGIKTQTPPNVCLKTLFRIICNDTNKIEMLAYEKRTKGSET